MVNAYWEPLTFELPPVATAHQQAWRRCIDTALEAPNDICSWESAPCLNEASYVVLPHSVVLLMLAMERPQV
jgi:glycogen operon protein